MLNIKIVTWSLGIFTATSFVLCVIYGLIVPQSLHATQFLEAVLPAFKWLTFWGFCLGLIESFLWGIYAGLVFVPIYNVLARRWGVAAAHQ
jgi:thiamine transporter ThiT